MIPRTEKFFEEIQKNKISVIIPSIVVSELLATIPPNDYDGFLSNLEEYYEIYPFDSLSAIIYSKLLYENSYKKQEFKEIRNQFSIRKEKMKLDHQIIAIAISNKAECIYSNDVDLKKFAKDIIEVKEIPDLEKQLDLF